MPATIPSLWPDDIKVDVLPPLVILKAQASKIGEITQGILTAEVTTVTGQDDFVVHRLDLIAPSLDGRRYRVLTATHRADFYPVVLEADCFRPKKVNAKAVKDTAMQIMAAKLTGLDTRTEYPTREWPQVDDWRPVASDENDFIKRVGEALRSPEVKAIITSMIALSNAKNGQPDNGAGEGETAA